MKINANGIAQQYELEGPANAPVVAMSHSLAANLSLWDAQAAALVPRYRVLRYDIRGHGGSDVPPAPYTLEQMAADLHGLMQALGIADAHFVGLSMGGLIGMTMALSSRAPIRSLVLADTTASYGPGPKAVMGRSHCRGRDQGDRAAARPHDGGMVHGAVPRGAARRHRADPRDARADERDRATSAPSRPSATATSARTSARSGVPR